MQTLQRCTSFLVLLGAFTVSAYGQYSGDLNDISNWGIRLGWKPTPIGDLGAVQTIVDLRGFVPLLLPWKQNYQIYKWFKVPTKKAGLLLYYGDLKAWDLSSNTSNDEANKFAHTAVQKEAEVSGDLAKWTDFAYKVATDLGPSVFERIAGSGFQSAEPISIFVTNDSVFVLVNFRYQSILSKIESINGQGQILTAFEFSKVSKRYKTFYELYSTAYGKASQQVFTSTTPLIFSALKAEFGL
jgi:hypothetical protein